MPYIPPPGRNAVDPFGPDTQPACTTGELNYQITVLVDKYIKGHLDYGTINAAIGVLECAKLELYRRIAALYEDQKRAKNGDVYTCGR